MNNPDEAKHLTGLLLEWPVAPIRREELAHEKSLRFEREIPGSKWEEYTYTSIVPFRGEEAIGGKAPYHYPIVIRRSGNRMLLLSVSKKIVEHLIEHRLNDRFPPYLRQVSIAVDGLVKAMVKRPTLYSLTFVHARVPAFGASLRSVSFYGDDLTEAALLRDHVDLMNFFTCGLRHSGGGQELLRVGGDGTISFFFNTVKSVQDVERTLSFLRENGYLVGDLFAKESAA